MSRRSRPTGSSMPARDASSSSGCSRRRVTDHLLRMRRADGSPVWVEVTARARPARSGGLLRVEALVRDVSERKAARRPVARPLPAAAAGREDGGARPDDLGRRARAEQPAGDDPQLGRAAGGEAARRDRAARRRRHSRRSRARRADRPQPADVRAQAAVDARDDRPQPGRRGNAGAARLRAASADIDGHDRRSPPDCRRCSPTRTRSSRCC